jgi:hypothetical protein
MPRQTVRMKRNAVVSNLVTRKHKKELMEIKKDLTLRECLKFYQEPANLEQFLAVVMEKSKISLRVLDYFVTKYSKPYSEGGVEVCYMIKKLNKQSKFFNVYSSYKAQLTNDHKDLFDPFRRHQRITFEYADDCEIKTTVAQLNFFRWAISNKVLDYVEKSLNRIIKHMKVNESPTPSPSSKKSSKSVNIKASISKESDEMVAEVEFH